jgi:hypothetical protein
MSERHRSVLAGREHSGCGHIAIFVPDVIPIADTRQPQPYRSWKVIDGITSSTGIFSGGCGNVHDGKLSVSIPTHLQKRI